jgi:hypothetical protein
MDSFFFSVSHSLSSISSPNLQVKELKAGAKPMAAPASLPPPPPAAAPAAGGVASTPEARQSGAPTASAGNNHRSDGLNEKLSKLQLSTGSFTDTAAG